MKPRSAKAKGKVLERFIRDTILEAFSELTDDDVRITVGSEGGADIKLSRRARTIFRYCVEAKNRETFTTLFKFYEQASRHGTDTPLLIVKMNRKEPLAIISFKHFMELITKRNGQ